MGLGTWVFDAASSGTPVPIGTGHYREDVKSGGATFSEDGSEATRVFLTDYGQVKSFVTDVLGYATNAGPTGVSRVLPEAHPDYPAFYASACKVTTHGVSSINGVKSEWTVARIETTFRPVSYGVLSDDDIIDELDRFVERKTHFKGDYLQLAINSFRWFTRPLVNGMKQPIGATPGIIVPSRTMEYIWREVPTLPADMGDTNKPFRCPVEAKIAAYLGTVNSLTFDQIYPPGTVLLVGAEAEMVRPVLNSGNFSWRIRYFFEQKDNGLVASTAEQAGCNYLYDPPNARFDLVTTDGTLFGQRLYNSANFNDLFEIP